MSAHRSQQHHATRQFSHPPPRCRLRLCLPADTDCGLLTCDPTLGKDVSDLFKYLTGYHRQASYKKLLVAPVAMRKHFADLIDAEIVNAKAGRPASITCKMNGLDDRVLVEKLYEAAQAGVQVDLIVRGICRIRPGVKGVSEKVRVVSVIGRFLEHHRIYRFHNDGDPKFYIGSADWMSRNLIRRVEVCVPIENALLKTQLQSLLDACLTDEINGWEMMPDGRYRKPCKQCKQHEPAGCAALPLRDFFTPPLTAAISLPFPPRLLTHTGALALRRRDGRLALRSREVGLHNALIEVRGAPCPGCLACTPERETAVRRGGQSSHQRAPLACGLCGLTPHPVPCGPCRPRAAPLRRALAAPVARLRQPAARPKAAA